MILYMLARLASLCLVLRSHPSQTLPCTTLVVQVVSRSFLAQNPHECGDADHKELARKSGRDCFAATEFSGFLPIMSRKDILKPTDQRGHKLIERNLLIRTCSARARRGSHFINWKLWTQHTFAKLKYHQEEFNHPTKSILLAVNLWLSLMENLWVYRNTVCFSRQNFTLPQSRRNISWRSSLQSLVAILERCLWSIGRVNIVRPWQSVEVDLLCADAIRKKNLSTGNNIRVMNTNMKRFHTWVSDSMVITTDNWCFISHILILP